MIILKKVLTLFIFACFTLTPTSHAMKSVDTEGEWKKINFLKPYEENIHQKMSLPKFSSNGEYFLAMEDRYCDNSDDDSDEISSDDSSNSWDALRARLHLWRINNFMPQKSFRIMPAGNYFFSPNGNFLVVEEKPCKKNNKFNIYSLLSCKMIASFENYFDICFFPDETFFSVSTTVSYSTNLIPEFKLFSLKSNCCIEIKIPNNIKSIKFSNNTSCKNCMTGVLYDNHNLDIFNMVPGCALKKKIFSFKNVYKFGFIQHSNLLKIKKFHVENYDEDDEVWDMSLMKKIDWDDTVTCSSDRKLCAKIDKKNDQLFVFEKDDKKNIATFENVKKFAFSSQGTFLGILSEDDTFFIWNTQIKKMSAIVKEIDDFTFGNLDNIVIISAENKHFSLKTKTFTYTPYKTPFDHQNYKNTTHQDHIKNFFSGQKPKNVNYSDLNILFK